MDSEPPALHPPGLRYSSRMIIQTLRPASARDLPGRRHDVVAPGVGTAPYRTQIRFTLLPAPAVPADVFGRIAAQPDVYAATAPAAGAALRSGP